MKKTFILAILILNFLKLHAETTQIIYLSGRGKDETVSWDFYCTEGRNSGLWTTIPVPSCWEQHGFGNYNYGHDYNKADEKGQYRYTFDTLNEWHDKKIFIVFEGSMTDTEVRINGQSAGDKHQGAFYRFQYDITDLVNFGQVDTLNVTVSKMSSNNSVNLAERTADYWVFGGIFRPVYLKIVPEESIERVAIDAKADGSFSVDVYLNHMNQSDAVHVQIEDIDGNPVGAPFSESIQSAQTSVKLNGNIANHQTWSAETPNLYNATVVLKDGETNIHSIQERFGFRTIEVRTGDGIYVNGSKVVFKGTNRHCFHPGSGRTLSDAINIMDVELMKEMNMNAVRMSHYPPDAHFLDVCDEKGLYVLNELAGWHDRYDSVIGTKLVKELVIRDVNHPCILFWDNGNEDGWNTVLDDDFAIWDPQDRKVLHPNKTYSGVRTTHYRTYNEVASILNGTTIYMTTEFLHGLYDGGHGAGLNDFWKLMMSKSLSAGGFTWTLIDEGIERTDMGMIIDTDGNHAPDGILTPYRDKEGSFYTIKEIWSPVYIELDDLPEDFDGSIPVNNRYSFVNLDQCTFKWKLVDFYMPDQDLVGYQIKKESTTVGPSVAPGESGIFQCILPNDWNTYDALYLTVLDHTQQELFTWTWPIKKPADYTNQIIAYEDSTVTKSEDYSYLIIHTNEHDFKFDKHTGNLTEVTHLGHRFTFFNGPVLCVGEQDLMGFTATQTGNDYLVEAKYEENLVYVRWLIDASGWVQLQYKYSFSGQYNYMGVSFNYPEDYVKGIKWLGQGPYRVYKNRLKGGMFNVWSKNYNNTITGASGWQYPEFKGYHADVNWAVLETAEGTMTIVNEDDDLFLRLFTPLQESSPKSTTMVYPNGDISFLDCIPATGTKFTPAKDLGPESKKNSITGDYSRTLHFFFDTRGRDDSLTSCNYNDPGAQKKTDKIPQHFSVEQNYPNPFNPETMIMYRLPKAQNVNLKIYNSVGQEIETLVNSFQAAGEHHVKWTVAGLPSGIYFYRLQAGDFSETKKLIVQK